MPVGPDWVAGYAATKFFDWLMNRGSEFIQATELEELGLNKADTQIVQQALEKAMTSALSNVSSENLSFPGEQSAQAHAGHIAAVLSKPPLGSTLIQRVKDNDCSGLEELVSTISWGSPDLKDRFDPYWLPYDLERLLQHLIPGLHAELKAQFRSRSLSEDMLFAYLERLHSALSADSGISVDSASKVYMPGERLKTVREGLDLPRSVLKDLIGINSEMFLSAIEERRGEIPEEALEELATFSGASVEWLKHGRGQPYPVQRFSVTNSDGVIKVRTFIEDELLVDRLYVLLETTHFGILIACKTYEYGWKVIDPGIHLDLWQWWDDRTLVGPVYDLLYGLRQMAGYVPAIVDEGQLKRFREGDEYPGKLIEELRPFDESSIYWLEDLVDIRHHSQVAGGYDTNYGEWFGKLQETFRSVR